MIDLLGIDEEDNSSDSGGGYTAGNLWLTGFVSAAATIGTIVGGGAIAYNVMKKNGMIQVQGGGDEDDE